MPTRRPSGNYQWGSSHLVIQNGILLAAAHELTGEGRFPRCGDLETIDYVLGRNALANSYVTGYGTAYLEEPAFALVRQPG